MPLILLNTNGTGKLTLANSSNNGNLTMKASEPIITAGLILNLDATNALSYPGTGTTWTDLSEQSNTGTLVGSPTYSSSPGRIRFGGSKYATTTRSDIELEKTGTFIAWIYSTQTQGGYTGIIFNRSGYGGSTAAATGMDLFTGNSVGYHWNDAVGTYAWNSGLITPNNEWAMIAVSVGATSATAYLCKSSGITTATNTVNHASLYGLNFYIAIDPANIPGRNFIGDIAIAMVYNTTLSLSDITTNFNAQKSRFGL